MRRRMFAEKVTEIAKMLVRMVALEGLQPTVTEAFFEKCNIQYGLDTVKKSNEEWKFWIVMITVFNRIGFAAVIVQTLLKRYMQILLIQTAS